MRIHPVRWLRERSLAQVATMAAGWPVALLLTGVAVYVLFWLGAWVLVWVSVAASFKLRVDVASWPGLIALLVLPPILLLLTWALLRLTKRAT